MSHHHHHSSHAFRWTVLLNAGLSGLQIVVGSAFGSIALIGDALHNLGDVAGLLLGWGADRAMAALGIEHCTFQLESRSCG